MTHTLALHLNNYVLRELIPQASYVGNANIVFRDIATHSRSCNRQTLFVALSGSHREEGAYLRQAAAQGAAGILTDFPLSDLATPQCIVPNVRRTYGLLCQSLAGRPAERLRTFGVTGTNGKTTVTWMLRSIVKAANENCGLLGTIEYSDGCHTPELATLTTPDAAVTAQWMRRMVQAGATAAAIEVSSHAIDQDRLSGVSLAGGIITNITHDHLDYHGSLSKYAEVKARIANLLQDDAPLVVNGDDCNIRNLLPHLPPETITVGFDKRNSYRIEIQEQTLQGTAFRLSPGPEGAVLRCPVPGRHNVYNAAFAAVLAQAAGYSLESISAGLASLVPPPGRLQPVETCQPFSCFVDYAHTPDAIAQTLQSLRSVTKGRLICLFGAGGERDREKRPRMARAAEQADIVVLTADNSRREPTAQILEEIQAGFSDAAPEVFVNADRSQAIQLAVKLAEPGDCVLILGKGHEKTQEIAGQRRDFDDVAEVCASIRKYYRQRPYIPAKRPA